MIRHFFNNIVLNKELLFQLVIKSLKIQYRRPVLGFFWTLGMPICLALVLKFAFSYVLRVEIRGYPFFVYMLTGLFPWLFFQNSLASAVNCILSSKSLIKESPFAKQIIPLSILLTQLIHFIPTLMVVFVVLIISKLAIPKYVFFLPIVVLINAGFIYGLSLIVSTLQVFYRDTRYLVDFSLMLLFYLTPIVYETGLLPVILREKLFYLYISNPMFEIVFFYRVCLLNGFIEINNFMIRDLILFGAIFSLWAIIVLFLGIYIFNKKKKTFVDYVSI